MKIAIPADEKSIDSNICISFGRAPYYIIYDDTTDEHYFMDNAAIAAQGGAGIKAAQSIADAKADILITPRCGQNAADILSKASIKMYKSIEGSLTENLNAFKENRLSSLDEIHEGYHK